MIGSEFAQVDIEYADGSVDQVATDPSWKCAASPIRRNSLYLGEVYDARQEQPGWDQPRARHRRIDRRTVRHRTRGLY